jgi:hypothetical protein
MHNFDHSAMDSASRNASGSDVLAITEEDWQHGHMTTPASLLRPDDIRPRMPGIALHET